MTAYIGRKVTMTWGGVTILGVQQKSISLNGAPIDITDVADNGWQELITTDFGQQDVKITVTGITKDHVLKTDWYGGIGGITLAKTLVLTYPDATVLQGTFMIAAYSEAQNYKAAATFSVEFHSTGTITYA